MGVQVTFDPAAFAALFPQITISANQLTTLVLPIAELYCRNDGGGPVPTAALQSVYLNMMVAHIAARYGTINGQQPSALVGRIANATEGSVTVGADFPLESPSQAWYATTKYGSDYWTATKAYRTFRYRVRRGCAYGGLYGARLAGIGY